MNKNTINDFCAVLHNVQDLSRSLDILSITINDRKIGVLVKDLESLKKIPGKLHMEDVVIIRQNVRAWKVHKGVEYSTLWEKEFQKANQDAPAS